MKLELLHESIRELREGNFIGRLFLFRLFHRNGSRASLDALRDQTDHASHAGLATDVEAARPKTIDQV